MKGGLRAHCGYFTSISSSSDGLVGKKVKGKRANGSDDVYMRRACEDGAVWVPVDLLHILPNHHRDVSPLFPTIDRSCTFYSFFVDYCLRFLSMDRCLAGLLLSSASLAKVLLAVIIHSFG
jgi:hypothetical protein